VKVRLTRRAERDLLAIMAWSRREFGRAAQLRYEALLNIALRDLAADPRRPGARKAEGAAEGVWLYHLRHARLRAQPVERVRQPRHVLVFRIDADQVRVLRVLHDAMDLPEHFKDI
jgi:toxin ParE1/3/4